MIEIKAKQKKNGEIIFLPKNKKNLRQIIYCRFLNGEKKIRETQLPLLFNE